MIYTAEWFIELFTLGTVVCACACASVCMHAQHQDSQKQTAMQSRMSETALHASRVRQVPSL